MEVRPICNDIWKLNNLPIKCKRIFVALDGLKYGEKSSNLNKIDMIYYESGKDVNSTYVEMYFCCWTWGRGDWNLDNLSNIQDISTRWTPFFYILKELSNDTKYVSVGPTQNMFFPRFFRFFPLFPWLWEKNGHFRDRGRDSVIAEDARVWFYSRATEISQTS